MNKLSIVIPCYNIVGKIDKLINSLNNQSNNEFEVIFVDDMSLDKSYEYLNSISSTFNFEYKILNNNINVGPGISRNHGIKKTSGNYITFLDADDYISNETVKIIYANLSKNIDILLFDFYVVIENKYKRWKSIDYINYGIIEKNDLLSYGNLSTVCKVYKKELIINNNVFFSEGTRGEDTTFTFKNYFNSQSIKYIDKALYYYIQHDQSLMKTTKPDEKINVSNYLELKKYLKEDNHVFLERYFIKNFMFSAVSNMINNRTKNKEIKKFIKKWSDEFPNWKKLIRKYQFPKSQKLALLLIYFRMINIFKIITKVRKSINRNK